jgi:hypothetical protein
MLPTEIRGRHSRLMLFQDHNDLFFAEPALPHLRLPSTKPRPLLGATSPPKSREAEGARLNGIRKKATERAEASDRMQNTLVDGRVRSSELRLSEPPARDVPLR